jgi:phage terminase large subunit
MNLDVTVVFERNWDAIHAVDENGERLYKYIINTGSSRSSKTVSICDCYDLYARSNPNKRMTAWRSTKKDCKDTVMVDFLKRLKNTNRFKQRQYNITESVYKYANDSIIEFRGTDEESVFGLTQECAWLNEPYSITRDIFDQIDQRTSDFIILDLNPKQDHWSDDLMKHPRAIVIHSTYKDNPFCPPEQRIKIESYDPANPINVINKTANQFKHDVYALGIKGEVEGKVFTNYEEIETIPASAKFYGYGFDYGYSKDPTAIVALYTNGNNIYLEELIYSTDLQPEMLHKEMLRVGMLQSELIIGDRTAGLMIDELYDRGWGDIHKAQGDNSILFGIAKMRECNIFIKGKNLVYEFDNYKNKKDKTGKWIDKPEENQMDHLCDSSRMIVTDYVTRNKFFVM